MTRTTDDEMPLTRRDNPGGAEPETPHPPSGLSAYSPGTTGFDLDVHAALIAIGQEVMRARTKFAPFNSAHEGYAVLLEEVDELWEEVKRRQSLRDPQRMRLEAIQVAAIAVRFLTDVGAGAVVRDKARTTSAVVAGSPASEHHR